MSSRKTKRRTKQATRRDTRRRVEQLAKNPLCRANAMSAVHDVPMKDVATSLGLEPKFGQSRFAITRGFTFERVLFRDDAKVLREHLVKASVLPADATGFLDLRLRLNGGPVHRLDEAHARTLELLERVAQRGAFEGMPTVVAGPALEVPGKALLPDGVVALDVLVLLPEEDRVVVRIGEVKVYPDRGGHTDGAQLSTARAQAGLYLHLLRRTVRERGWEHAIRVADDGFLVLSRAGQNTPRVRVGEDLVWQARRAEVAVQRLQEAASQAVGDEKRRLQVVAEAPSTTATAASPSATSPIAATTTRSRRAIRPCSVTRSRSSSAAYGCRGLSSCCAATTRGIPPSRTWPAGWEVRDERVRRDCSTAGPPAR